MTIPPDPAAGLDLTSCDTEPIHIPGRVQPHGALFALNEHTLAIEQASANAAAFVGDPLPATAPELVEPAQAEAFAAWVRSDAVRDGGPVRFRFGAARRPLDCVAHRHAGVLILEVEDGHPAGFDAARSGRQAAARLQAAGSLRAFCDVAVAELRALTGFEHVLVYRFHPDWSGEVVAESVAPGVTPLAGLRFPATDIPAQARRLYVTSRIRLIADVAAEPVPVVPADNPRTGRPLDLSLAHLRSVSPVHLQYLKNMGARTSMSISLVRDGRLWGLLTCMQFSGPKAVPPAVRDACEFLGTLVSLQLAIKEDSEGAEERDRLRAVRERLMQQMARTPDLASGLGGDDLLALTNATGAAVVSDAACTLVGRTPSADGVKRLVAWLRAHADGDPFATDGLPALVPEAADYADTASGLVAITTAKAHGHWVLWFRPEVAQTITWGGDPSKSPDGSGGLSPRTSFAVWREAVRGKALPWRPWELEAARLLRDAILAVVVRRAEELTRLNAELERSNSDLDAFAFVTSHDLKEPLRGIHSYANFVMEDYADKLDAAGVSKLQTLVNLSQRMEDLVESLLHFSRLGRAELTVEPIDLNDVVAEVLDLLRVTLDERGVEVRVSRPLPTVRADRVQVGQLYNNLVTNAVKYNNKPDPWVEIGAIDPVGEADRPRPPTLYVRDNGIGIAEKHAHAVFRMFKRLHGRDKFGGGTGAGLAFAKKIVERHGGSLWVASSLGAGATFLFTLEP